MQSEIDCQLDEHTRFYYRVAVDFKEFVKAVGQHYIDAGLFQEIPDLHYQIADDLQAGHEYIAICAFRRSAKSWIIQLYIIWRIFLNHDINVLLLIGESRRIPFYISEIMSIIESVPWLKFLNPSNKNDQLQVRISNQRHWPTLLVKSSGSNIRGIHSDLVLCDDLISTYDIFSLANQRKIMDVANDIPNLLNPITDKIVLDALKTRCISIHTPSDRQPNNFYQKSSDSNNFFNRFEEKRYPAVIEPQYDGKYLVDGQSAWPEQHKMDKLIDEQHLNPLNFDLNKMVSDEPLDDEHSLIRFADLPVTDHPPLYGQQMAAYIDTAGGGYDEFAYLAGGVARDKDKGTYYYVHEVSGYAHMDSEEAYQRILYRLHNIGITRVYVEKDSGMEVAVRHICKEQGYRFSITHFTTHLNKEKKLKRNLPQYLNSQNVVFNRKCFAESETVDQIRGLRADSPLPTRDDRIECMFFALHNNEHLLRGSGPTGQGGSINFRKDKQRRYK